MMRSTILIADDDRDSVRMYEKYLTCCGYRVLTASSGIECLHILRDESPIAIVASVDVPWGGIDGLLDYLSEESDPQFGHFVILTGYTAEHHVTALSQNRCVLRYLRKPFLMARLLDHVRAIEFGLREVASPHVRAAARQPAVACQ